MTHESEITLQTQRAEKIGQHGAAFVFQNAAHETRGMRALTIAPAHIGQGSSVT